MRRRSSRGRKPEQRCGRLAAEEDVGADVEIVGQRQVLVDRLDADLAGVARSCAGRPARPCRRSRPRRAGSTPEIALIRVDLPAPLSPASATTSPRCSSKPTPSRARARRRSAWSGRGQRGSAPQSASRDLAGEPLAGLVDQHRDDDDDADGHELPERLDVDEDQAVLDHGDDQGTDTVPMMVPEPPNRLGAADDHRRDRIEQQRLAALRGAGREAGGVDHARDAGAAGADQVEQERVAADVDAGADAPPCGCRRWRRCAGRTGSATGPSA